MPPLRDYQQEALARMQHYEGRAALLVLATGLGKTRIFTEFLRWEVNENDHHCLILSHREELVHQPLTYLQDLTCGVELAERSRCRFDAEHHVLGHSEHRDEHEVLMDHADPGRDGVTGRFEGDGLTIDEDLAFVGVVQPVHDVHQRRLARPVFADEREYFA